MSIDERLRKFPPKLVKKEDLTISDVLKFCGLRSFLGLLPKYVSVSVKVILTEIFNPSVV